jgi:hypothetical protein
MPSTPELIKQFANASNDEKVQLLFGSENEPDHERIVFLLQVANNTKEYDLVRIEAIKSAGLSALHVPADRDPVVQKLLDLSQHDADDDIRNYALQALAWHRLNATELDSVATLLLNEDEDEMVRENAFSVITSRQIDNSLKKPILQKIADDPVFGESAQMELESIE